MAKTISIDEIRKRKESTDTNNLPVADESNNASPSSYVILLDEEAQSPSMTHSEAKRLTNHGHNNH